MKLLIYAYPQWAFGQLHNGLANELRKRGWEVYIMDWTKAHGPLLTAAADSCDVVMTIADGAPALVREYNIPREKITIVAHAEADLQSLISTEGIDTFKQYARYGVVGDSLVCSSLALGVPRIPTVLRVGVEWARFACPVASQLTSVGYAARYSRLTNSGIEQKRGHLARACAEGAGLTFVQTEDTPMDLMPGFYASVSAYVFPSLMEASPLPPLEAAAAGRLLIGTPAGHFSRLAYEGCGILGPLGEQEFLEFTVKELLWFKSHPNAYREKCQWIQTSAQGRDWSRVADDWVSFFTK